jgi:hypothetical protein
MINKESKKRAVLAARKGATVGLSKQDLGSIGK